MPVRFNYLREREGAIDSRTELALGQMFVDEPLGSRAQNRVVHELVQGIASDREGLLKCREQGERRRRAAEPAVLDYLCTRSRTLRQDFQKRAGHRIEDQFSTLATGILPDHCRQILLGAGDDVRGAQVPQSLLLYRSTSD